MAATFDVNVTKFHWDGFDLVQQGTWTAAKLILSNNVHAVRNTWRSKECGWVSERIHNYL